MKEFTLLLLELVESDYAGFLLGRTLQNAAKNRLTQMGEIAKH